MDLGKYKCFVNAGNYSSSATIDVTNILSKANKIIHEIFSYIRKFVFLDDTFFNVTTHSQFNHIELSTNKSSEMFLVKYLAYPEPKLKWFDKENKSIQWTLKEDINRKFEVYRDLNKKWTALKIRNATILDSGNYTLTVSNGPTKENKTFQLLILGNH